MSHAAPVEVAPASSGPLVISCDEQGPVNIPVADLLDASGKLALNSDVESGDFFAVSLRKGVITLRARGYIGFIPLTKGVVVHVTPRVPVSNLARLIELSGEPPTVLTSMREYPTAEEWNESLLDIYARALTKYVETIGSEGLLRQYVRHEDVGSFPHGRVLQTSTMRLAARNVRHKAGFAFFARTSDNPPNRCLKYAVWLLAQRYIVRGRGDRTTREIRSQLNALYPMFGDVTLDHSRAFLADEQVQGIRPLPSHRQYYRDPLNVAVAVIRQQAVLLDQPGTDVRLPSIVVNMNRVVEGYIRTVLRHYVETEDIDASVLDGNDEGKRGLFDGKRTPEATPDVVVEPRDRGVPPLVLDVKNVPLAENATTSDRDSVNQIVTYVLAYRAQRGVLVHPRASALQAPGLHRLGTIDQVAVYQYRFDFGAADLQAEDERFGAEIAQLL